MCPWCYIGKRRLEAALEHFPHKDSVKVSWKSFQLNPGMVTDTSRSINQYLMESKGWTEAYTQQVSDHVKSVAKEAGLEYHFDKAIVANSFDAHRLLQFAKTKGLGDALKENLLRAYFTEGKNTADHTTLLVIGVEAGLAENEVREVLASDAYGNAVRHDVQEAQQLGVSGVPFFVINRKYGISGAQPSGTFTSALEQIWAETENAAE